MKITDNIVEVQNLGKYFGHIKAVDGITFNVKKGDVLGFLGPNGAGKSTTMKILTGFIAPDFGKAVINGFDILKNPLEIKKIFGYLPENAPSYEDMTVFSFIDFIADIRGLKGKVKDEQIKKTFELISIQGVKDQIIGTLSKGYKRRVGLAQAIIHDPLILILDEPTDGLDPNQKHEVRELIRKMSKEKVIILSTHILEEVDEVCNRTVIISKGKIVADKTPDSLREESEFFRSVNIVLEKDIVNKAKSLFKTLKNINHIDTEYEKDNLTALNIFPKNKEKIVEDIINVCTLNSFKIHGLSENSGNLAEVFRNLTSMKDKV